MEGKTIFKEDQDRWCWIGWWQMVLESWRKTPNNERSADIIHL